MTEMARIERVILLQRVDLLASCSAEQILRISAITRQGSFNAGEVIYRSGEPANALYFIEQGAVELSPGEDDGALGLADTFGVTEILSGRMRTQTATALENSRVLAIDADDFFDLLSNNIEIVKALFRQLLGEQQAPADRAPGTPTGEE